jgi:uncharacterized protein (TIGR02466 family)
MLSFGSQFFIYTCNYANKKTLIDRIQQKYALQKTRKHKTWDENVHTSIVYDKYTTLENYILKSEIPQDLVVVLNQILQNFIEKQNLQSLGEFRISEIWYNAYSRGQYQNMHKHSNGNNNIFSGIYYIKFDPQQHSNTRFYNPSFEIDFSKVKNNSYFVFQPTVKENDIIFFPSDIGHDVPEQICDELRITISFNIQCIYYEHMQYT